MQTERTSDFNGSAGHPSSKVQIQALEETRKMPIRTLELTPAQARWTYRLNYEDTQHNRGIDQKQSAMKKRLAKREKQSMQAFNKAKDRRGNDQGR